MDPLDELMAEVAKEAKDVELKREQSAVSAASKRSAASTGSPTARSSDATFTTAQVSPEVRTIMGRLERLRLDLADPEVKEALQTALAQAEPQETLDYYLARPALAQYTLQTELPRMAYRVVPREGGSSLTGAAEIAALHAADEGRRSVGEDRGPEVLWRMANQSLFAGVLEVVHKLVVVPHDQGGALCLAASTDKAEFDVDLARGQLSASCALSLGTIKSGSGGRLGLATVSLSAHVGVSGDGCTCLGFSQAVSELRPEVVFDEQLAAAAAALLELSPEAAIEPQGAEAGAEAGAGGEASPGFASARAAAALGEITTSISSSAIGAAATASASAFGLVSQGLGALRLGGGTGETSDEGKLSAAPKAASGLEGLDSEFDDLFNDLAGSAPVTGNEAAGGKADSGGRNGGKDFAGLFDRLG